MVPFSNANRPRPHCDWKFQRFTTRIKLPQVCRVQSYSAQVVSCRCMRVCGALAVGVTYRISFSYTAADGKKRYYDGEDAVLLYLPDSARAERVEAKLLCRDGCRVCEDGMICEVGIALSY